jgi:hypothetical protein
MESETCCCLAVFREKCWPDLEAESRAAKEERWEKAETLGSLPAKTITANTEGKKFN